MELDDMNEQLEFPIFNTEMTLDAMRNSGYKSTTHALAELIDNAIEARASVVEIFGVSRRSQNTGRLTLDELAVLDNGEGMDRRTLCGSLSFGYGTRGNRHGIGRFGVGLPNSSLSQAKKVDVWSWQNGITNALHTKLSLDDVKDGVAYVPIPEHRPIPKVYREASHHGFEDSGTLVVWTELDNVEWKRAATTFLHTEALLGRIYRRFLAKKGERLHGEDSRGEEIGVRRMISCIPVTHVDEVIETLNDEIVVVRPNDPLYLMTGTSCPEDFGRGPMFTELEGSPFSIPIEYGGQQHLVRVRASYARQHVRNSGHPDASWPQEWVGRDSGHTPWGKHADHNMGISVIRAHREIEIDSSWTNGSDPRERWWSIEVDIPTALDEVFGVTNNKQGTMRFQRVARFDWKREALPGEATFGDVRRRMEADGDDRVFLLELRKQIEKAIEVMRPRVRESAQRRDKRHELTEDQKADKKATAAINRRIKEGYEGESDIAEREGTPEEHVEAQVKSLVERHHFDEADALERVVDTIESQNKVRWIQSSQTVPAFFDFESLPGVLQVALNTNHPVHSYLYDLMHPELEDMEEDDIRDRLAKAAAAFRILVYSWARFEEEQDGLDKRRARDARLEWGKYAEEFFDEEDRSVAPTDLV